MRNAPRAALLAIVAMAAAMAAAPSTSAQTEPLIHDQAPRLIVAQEVHAAGDTPCPLVTPSPAPVVAPMVTGGGCRLHFASNGPVVTSEHITGGVEVVTGHCNWEFDARIDAAGEGWISHQELTGPNPGCTRQACEQPTPPTGEGRAWSFYLRETEDPGGGVREEAIVLFCSSSMDNPVEYGHCEFTIPFTQPTRHRYRLVANEVSRHGQIVPYCEHTGILDVEAALGTSGEGQLEQNVEIRHN